MNESAIFLKSCRLLGLDYNPRTKARPEEWTEAENPYKRGNIDLEQKNCEGRWL